MLEALKELCKLSGVSGREDNVRNYILNRICPFCDVTFDALGNIIAFVKGKKRAAKRVMVDAHMDEVGFIITAVTDDGLLKFETVGGIDTSVLLARRVIIGGGVVGVISMKPIHMLKGDEKKKYPEKGELYIDIGAVDKGQALELVSPGDVAVFDVGFQESGDMLLSKALDDRAGCAALIDIIENGPEYDFYATFTVQEEVGLRGAKTAAFSVDPDYSIVFESTTAADIAGVPDDKKVCLIGKGATVSFMDSATLYDKELFDKTLQVAEKKNIPCQVKCYVSGGNNAGAIHLSRSGVKTVAISVPCRYIHSPSSIASFKDIEAVRNLGEAMLEVLASGDK